MFVLHTAVTIAVKNEDAPPDVVPPDVGGGGGRVAMCPLLVRVTVPVAHRHRCRATSSSDSQFTIHRHSLTS
jgi:hypothetical protein